MLCSFMAVRLRRSIPRASVSGKHFACKAACLSGWIARRSPSVGRGCLLPNRKRPGPQRPRSDGYFFEGRSGGTPMMISQPDAGGHYGPYGGKYVPEVLMAPLEELEKAYSDARQDRCFQEELNDLLRNYAGRPTPLYFARRLSEHLGGARIYFKREDLLHTGAHKINNSLGQGLLA